MKKRIEFNESDLIDSMREALAHAKGNLTLKTTKVPAKTRSMSPAVIAQIRRKLKASTPVFAAYLNVTPDTVRGWEKNRRHPSGPALRLLQIAEKKPQLLLVSA
jgi:putative transcriptional regulator